MISSPDQLPLGWAAEWDTTHQRYLFIEISTGNTSWDPPIPVQVEGQPPASGSPPPVHHVIRRQYAVGQTQAHEVDAPMDTVSNADLEIQELLFTPGIAVDNRSVDQQTQAGASGQPQYAHASVDALVGQMKQMDMGQKNEDANNTNKDHGDKLLLPTNGQQGQQPMHDVDGKSPNLQQQQQLEPSSPSHSSMMSSVPLPGMPPSVGGISPEMNLFDPGAFMDGMGTDFDPSALFRPDGDINFERDFGQWFNPDDTPLGQA